MDFEKLANRHKDAVYRQMVRLCGNRDDAEDVLVESLVNAYKASETLKSDEAFQAWLAQIARRTCGRLRKREAAHALVALADLNESRQPSDPAASPVEKAIESETKQCVEVAIATLPAIYADIYRLRDVDGLSAEETSAQLGISIAAVKSRLHRARSMVREKLDGSLCGPISA